MKVSELIILLQGLEHQDREISTTYTDSDNRLFDFNKLDIEGGFADTYTGEAITGWENKKVIAEEFGNKEENLKETYFIV